MLYRTESSMPKALATTLLVLIIAAAAYWLFKPQEVAEPTPAPVAATPAAPALSNDTGPALEDDTPLAQPPDTAPVIPASVAQDDGLTAPPASLDASDAIVLAAVSQLSPDVTAWLLPEEQIRKWVALVNALADGKVPVKNRPLEYPLPPFQVLQQDNTLWLDRASYRRASDLIKALTQMPPSRVARHYAAWQPLLQNAQDELGNGARFSERLHTAIDRVLAVQPLTGDIELKAGVLKYTYADPAREKASALEKLLWRLGPSNTLRIQNYLRDLKPLL